MWGISQVTCDLLAPADERWHAFVVAMPQATVFHHPAWSELLAASYGFRPFVLVAYDDAGQIAAGVPLAEVRSLFTGRRWVSLPYSDHCSPLYKDAQSLERLTDSLVKLSESRGVPQIWLRWAFPERPTITPHSQYVLHQLPLQPDTKQQSRRMDGMHRQNIRLARKNEIRIERGVSLDHIRQFYQLQLETRQRKGLPAQPWRFFRLLKEHILDRELGFVLLAYKGADCLAGAVCLHWQRSLMCKYAASHEEALALRPNNLLFWTAICWGCENGYQTFDMGRSALDNQGLRDFKSRWGAEETPLFYSAIAAPLQKQRGDGRLMQAMGTVIRRSPVWVTRVMGDLLYRHFD